MPATYNQHSRLWHSTSHLSLLLMALSTTLACHRPHDDTLPRNSLQLLETMAPSPTESCQHQQPSFFPDVLQHNHQPQQAAHTAFHILQNLFHTLSSNRIPQHWDIQARHDLLNSLQHHIQHLQQCLPAHKKLFKRQGPRNLMLNINKYFRRIHDFLRIHNHSACAWDHIRLEARLCFKHVNTLFRQMK
ncbi:IFN protein, partial [Geococcyx californianus]|nr:IFN protein [Geococcyx californianus]